MKLGYKSAWLILLVIVAVVATMVAVPVWLIQPFAPQTPRSVEISYFLRSWSPIATVILAIAALAIAVVIWRGSRRWFGKAVLVLPLLIVGVFTWFAFQNHFEWMFNPLGEARFAKVSEADFLADKDMVLAINVNGDAVAFPVRLMAYHHVAQDVVGGTPITATY
jgi:membrane protease YdiL (CAAX protease family)